MKHHRRRISSFLKKESTSWVSNMFNSKIFKVFNNGYNDRWSIVMLSYFITRFSGDRVSIAITMLMSVTLYPEVPIVWNKLKFSKHTFLCDHLYPRDKTLRKATCLRENLKDRNNEAKYFRLSTVRVRLFLNYLSKSLVFLSRQCNMTDMCWEPFVLPVNSPFTLNHAN